MRILQSLILGIMLSASIVRAADYPGLPGVESLEGRPDSVVVTPAKPGMPIRAAIFHGTATQVLLQIEGSTLRYVLNGHVQWELSQDVVVAALKELRAEDRVGIDGLEGAFFGFLFGYAGIVMNQLSISQAFYCTVAGALTRGGIRALQEHQTNSCVRIALDSIHLAKNANSMMVIKKLNRLQLSKMIELLNTVGRRYR